MAKILIVNTVGVLRTALGLCCLRRGHAIIVAHDPATAVQCLASHAPDLLITDLQQPMPDYPVVATLPLGRQESATGDAGAARWVQVRVVHGDPCRWAAAELTALAEDLARLPVWAAAMCAPAVAPTAGGQ